jgi:hypothetical protein
MSRRTRQRAAGAHVALTAAYAAMLLTGTAAAAADLPRCRRRHRDRRPVLVGRAGRYRREPAAELVFTPPLHTFTIDKPQNLLALLLYVTVAVTISSVVHLAARRAGQAARSRGEAASLLALGQAVLGDDDTAAAALDHLTGTWAAGPSCWNMRAANGSREPPAATRRRLPPAPASARGRAWCLPSPGSPGRRLLDGFAAQAAAALDRERLRTQAARPRRSPRATGCGTPC